MIDSMDFGTVYYDHFRIGLHLNKIFYWSVKLLDLF